LKKGFDEMLGCRPCPPNLVLEARRCVDRKREDGSVIISLMLKMSQRTYLLKMGRVAYEGSSAALLDGDRIREIFL